MAKKQAVQVDSSGAHIVDLADAAVPARQIITGIVSETLCVNGAPVSYDLEGGVLTVGSVQDAAIIPAAPSKDDLQMFARTINALVYDCHSLSQREETAAPALEVLNGYLK